MYQCIYGFKKTYFFLKSVGETRTFLVLYGILRWATIITRRPCPPPSSVPRDLRFPIRNVNNEKSRIFIFVPSAGEGSGKMREESQFSFFSILIVPVVTVFVWASSPFFFFFFFGCPFFSFPFSPRGYKKAKRINKIFRLNFLFMFFFAPKTQHQEQNRV